MKAIKILSLFTLCFLFQACPEDDTPDFFVTVINNSDEKIFYHSRGFRQNQELPENSINDWDPRISDNRTLLTSDSVNQGIDFDDSTVYSLMIYKESTFEENDWETIRDEGLFDARFDLTDDELAEMDYTIEFTGE